MTGCSSVGELAITRRISAVAVCCSSDSVTCACASVSARFFSCSSVKSRDVLDRDHGLVGEGPQQRNLGVGERLDLDASDPDRADGFALAQQRNDSAAGGGRGPERHATFRNLLHLGLQIRHLDGLPIKHRASVFTVPGQSRARGSGSVGIGVMAGRRRGHCHLGEDARVIGGTRRAAILAKAFKHGLQVGRRGRDGPQVLARRRLLLERLFRLVE